MGVSRVHETTRRYLSVVWIGVWMLRDFTIVRAAYLIHRTAGGYTCCCFWCRVVQVVVAITDIHQWVIFLLYIVMLCYNYGWTHITLARVVMWPRCYAVCGVGRLTYMYGRHFSHDIVLRSSCSGGATLRQRHWRKVFVTSFVGVVFLAEKFVAWSSIYAFFIADCLVCSHNSVYCTCDNHAICGASAKCWSETHQLDDDTCLSTSSCHD